MDDSALGEFFELAYPEQHLTKNQHCLFYLSCRPDLQPSGNGRILRHGADGVVELCDQARRAGMSVHMCVAALNNPATTRPSYGRLELGEGSRHYVVADIDLKEQVMDEAQLLQAFAQFTVPPTYILDSANGYHLYWMSAGDLSTMRYPVAKGLIDQVIKPLGIVADQAVSYRELGTIRMPGTMGKGGQMVVGQRGVKTGRQYDVFELCAAAGFASEHEAETAQKDWESSRHAAPLSSWQTTLYHVDRDRLFQACPAFTAFVASSGTEFGHGTEGNRKDVQMFANLCSRQVDAEKETDYSDLGQHIEKRKFFEAVVSKWPGYNPEWGSVIYDFAASSAPFGCDKWGAFGKHCASCPASVQQGQNPISYTRSLVNHYVAAAMPVVTTPSTMNTVQRVGSPAAVLAGFQTPHDLAQHYLAKLGGHYTANAEVLFKVGTKKGGEAYYEPVCSPPIFLVDDVVAKPINDEHGVLCERAVFGQWDPVTATGELFTLTAADLRNPNRMAEALVNPKVTVLNARLMADFYRDSARAAKSDYTISYQQLGWQSPTKFVTPYCEVYPTEVVGCAMTKDISTLLVDDGQQAVPAPQGTPQGWVDGVLKPLLAAGPVAMPHIVLIVSSLASVLFKLMERHGSGPLVCIHGHTGRGKSQALRLAMSVWYSSTGKAASARDTPVSTRLRMAAMNNLPVMLDETTNIDPDFAYDLVYELTNSAPRSASTNMGTNLRETLTWCNSVLITSNEAFQATIGNSRNRVDAAALSRVVDIPVASYSNDDMAKAIDAAMRAAEDNYGVIGIHFVQFLMNNTALVQQWLQEESDRHKALEKALSADENYEGSPRFRIAHMSAVNTTARCLDSMGLNLQLYDRLQDYTAEFSRALSADLSAAVMSHGVDFNVVINRLLINQIPYDKDTLLDWFAKLPDHTRLPPPDQQVPRSGNTLYATKSFVLSLLKEQYHQRGSGYSYKTDMEALRSKTANPGPGEALPVFNPTATRRRIWVIKDQVKSDPLHRPEIINPPQRVLEFDARWLTRI
jgi:hypothetical protein